MGWGGGDGAPGFDLYSLSKCNFLSNPLTFTDGLVKPPISLRVRWPQHWCKWLPISDKIKEEYHQEGIIKTDVKMNKSVSVLMWLIIILGIYVKNVNCDKGCQTHYGSLQDGMKCVWTVWSCCSAISPGQHYVIASPNYESLESGSRSWVLNEISHILIKFLPFPPFLIAAVL